MNWLPLAVHFCMGTMPIILVRLVGIGMTVALYSPCSSGHYLVLIPVAIATEIARWVEHVSLVSNLKICASWQTPMKATLTLFEFQSWHWSSVSNEVFTCVLPIVVIVLSDKESNLMLSISLLISICVSKMLIKEKQSLSYNNAHSKIFEISPLL